MTRNQLPPQADEAVRTARCRFSAVAPLTRLRALLPGAISGPTDPSYKSNTSPIPGIPIERRRASSIAASLDQDEGLAEKITEHGVGVPDIIAKEETVLYLAYGSNLASKTFRGVRGINPLSQMGVFVPELRLTFDLPGVPYAEPCFAGTQYRDPSTPPTHDFDFPLEDDETDVSDSEYLSEKAALMSRTLEVEVHGAGYHKRRWYKPLVGVVYEVTLADYAKIIATEGGGRGYRDGVIDCYPFPEDYDPSDPVPYQPSTTPFKARTLLSPAADDARLKMQSLKSGASLLSHGPKLSWWYTVCLHFRPDPDYAQPSARYLGLIKTGAEEHDLPETYREYLAQIRTYRITTTRQKVGKGIFLALWLPWVLLALTLSKIFAGSDGRSPQWLVALSNVLFSGMWKSYDRFFARVFGDGERTLDDIPAW